MLLVDAYLDKSPIQGIGLFAKHPIAKGTQIWVLDCRFDRLIERELYESLTGAVKSYLDRYAYPHRPDPRYIVFEADDARYMNHADDPNCDFSRLEVAYALRDIAAGEEMTCDYSVFFEDGFEFLGDR
jgi:SET domain-containing protein